MIYDCSVATINDDAVVTMVVVALTPDSTDDIEEKSLIDY